MKELEDVFGTSKLSDLRAMSAADLLKAVESRPGHPAARFWPDIDGYFLTEDVAATYAAGKQAHIPLLAGWNRDEGFIPQKAITMAEYHAWAQKEFGPNNARKFLTAYAATNGTEAIRALRDYAGDRFLVYATWRWIEAQVATGGKPVYRYHFELPSPGDKFHAAGTVFHSDDIEYVFGTLDSRKGMNVRPEDRAVSELMQSYWTNFAKTGDPNGPGLPKWPAYNAATNWQVMHLNAESEARPDKTRARYEFLNEVWSKPTQ